ncbi:hypothetical protein HHK36_009245 [Tetracentron sinense]|uniref:Uncharacterized protein n=1 Tax=Tetracentron sinense TaxID=13715 RepID=A0A834ZKZ0_TETSI|nr:hypothetical protein HHK36_009245 [Tetracentron sinense]
MEIVESILDIPLQDPPGEDFYSADLNWTKFGNAEHHDDVALIPYERVDSFIVGECTNVECPTRFHIERGRKRTKGSLKDYKSDEYLEYRLYWCSFGPENYGEGGGILPSRRYRLNTRNRAARPQSMRGCTCHFVVKRLYARPSVALIIYNDRRHVNKSGFVCHGPLDRDAIGPGAKKIPYICNEIQQQTMSLIYLGIPEENVLQKHIEGVQRYCGSNAKVNSLASQYVHKLGMIIKRSTHELDLDDQASIRMWVERNKKSIFFYQDSSDTNPFILGIQTEWQLQQMIRFGHHSLMAADSTFGIKKLKYPLCTLLVFDSRQHALPIAWVITRSFAKQDVSKWMKALVHRARTVDTAWKISGFLIDDAAAEVDPIRQEALDGCILLSCSILPLASRKTGNLCKHIIKKGRTFIRKRRRLKRLRVSSFSIFRRDGPFVALPDVFQWLVDLDGDIQLYNKVWYSPCSLDKANLPRRHWLLGNVLQTMSVHPGYSRASVGTKSSYHHMMKSHCYGDIGYSSMQTVPISFHNSQGELRNVRILDRYEHLIDQFDRIEREWIFSIRLHSSLDISCKSVIFCNSEAVFDIVLFPLKSSKLARRFDRAKLILTFHAQTNQGKLLFEIEGQHLPCFKRLDFRSCVCFRKVQEKPDQIQKKLLKVNFSWFIYLALVLTVFKRIRAIESEYSSIKFNQWLGGLELKEKLKKKRKEKKRKEKKPSNFLSFGCLENKRELGRKLLRNAASL